MKPVEQRRSRPVPRVAVLGVVVVVIAVAGFTDRSPSPPAVAGPAAMPVAAPAGALSSSWFCAGPANMPSHLADGRLIIANEGGQALHGTVALLPSNGASRTQNIEVNAHTQLVLDETDPTASPYLGADVELDGGQAAVEQVVAGSEGTSSTACASSGGTNWYFPTGTTQESSTLSLLLLNPYPDDAIADLSFTTEQGQEDPEDFQGIVIPAGTLVGVDIGSHLHLRASIATTVTLRVGRVAAFETEVVQSQSAATLATEAPGAMPWPPGITLARGAPSTETTWWWPSGVANTGATEEFVIYNPGSGVAQVSLLADLDQGSADPFQLSVDPYATAVVTMNNESRIPVGVGHGTTLRSANGVGVVATRLALSNSMASPSGLSAELGSSLTARQWLVTGAGDTGMVNSALVIYNPASVSVKVAISSLDGSQTLVKGQAAVVISGHHRYVFASQASGTNATVDGPLVVSGSGPVVVEQDISPAKAIGIDASIGVPLAGA